MRTTEVGSCLLVLGYVLSPAPALGVEGGAPAPAPAPPNDPSAPLQERVDQAIASGLRWLRSQASVAGTFGEIKGETNYLGGKDIYDYPAGPTALALYTLLKCGVPAEDPLVAKGFAWLRSRQQNPGSNYEVAALLLALEAKSDPWKREKDREKDAKSRLKKGQKLDLGIKPPPEDAAWMKKLVGELQWRRSPKGAWRYGQIDPRAPKDLYVMPGADTDMSNTQLALLGLMAAERCGIASPVEVYERALAWTLDRQESNGPSVARFEPGAAARPDREVSSIPDRARGWFYVEGGEGRDGKASGAMTACGLANIALARAVLRERDADVFGKKYAVRAEKAWWDGVAWLQHHWTVADNPGAGNSYRTYYLYCVERVGDLTGLHLLGGHDWYTEGATAIVDAQQPSGFWKDTSHEPADLLTTCFALLFLNRATPAVTGE